MCTVIIEVPKTPGSAIRVCAVRDENPERPWDPLGEWWPATYPGISGVRDRVAGGAWMAVDRSDRQLAVILNRAEPTLAGAPAVSHPRASRGTVVLHAVTQHSHATHPDTAPYNLVTIRDGHAYVTSWDGSVTRTLQLSPGVHMVAHHEVNDPTTPRIAAWLHRFQRLAGAADSEWRAAWLHLLTQTAALPPTDDRAIIRDNRPHGYPTLSLLVCLGEVSTHQLSISTHALADPGHWPPAPARDLLG